MVRTNLVKVKTSVVGGGERVESDRRAQEGVVSRLDGEDPGRGGEVRRVGEEASGSDVGRYSHTLEDLSNREERRGRGVGEGVVAGGNGSSTGGSDGGGQELDVVRLPATGQLVSLEDRKATYSKAISVVRSRTLASKPSARKSAAEYLLSPPAYCVGQHGPNRSDRTYESSLEVL